MHTDLATHFHGPGRGMRSKVARSRTYCMTVQHPADTIVDSRSPVEYDRLNRQPDDSPTTDRCTLLRLFTRADRVILQIMIRHLFYGRRTATINKILVLLLVDSFRLENRYQDITHMTTPLDNILCQYHPDITPPPPKKNPHRQNLQSKCI